ncbi:MAG TPA: hypothetical protein VGL50_05560 [Steroidobacteraceae bacterium]|jgi:amino acid transporter
MSADHSALSHHPAPHRERVAPLAAVFGAIGGPLAWFVEICAGYALASGPCFKDAARVNGPVGGFGWTFPAMVALMLVCVLVALGAFAVSYTQFTRTRSESEGGHEHLMEVGGGRTRFVALWGMLLGAGFAVAAVISAVAFALLPRCAG